VAYLARIDTTDARPLTLAGFSPLEWSIIRLSRLDPLWTIRPLGPLRRLWNWLIGRGNPALSNERLEALRRISVLSWHFGFTVPGDDVADFLSAGFTPDQYELLVNSVRRTRMAPLPRNSTAEAGA
jgi:hypothetical protein